MTIRETTTRLPRRTIIEDALSPIIERAKIAYLSHETREKNYWSRYRRVRSEPRRTEQMTRWADLLNAGHPSRVEIRAAFRGRGLGRISRGEVRGVIIRAILRDAREQRERAWERLDPMQRLARTVANWIMDAFDEACWMSESEAEHLIASARPHTIAG